MFPVFHVRIYLKKKRLKWQLTNFFISLPRFDPKGNVKDYVAKIIALRPKEFKVTDSDVEGAAMDLERYSIRVTKPLIMGSVYDPFWEEVVNKVDENIRYLVNSVLVPIRPLATPGDCTDKVLLFKNWSVEVLLHGRCAFLTNVQLCIHSIFHDVWLL